MITRLGELRAVADLPDESGREAQSFPVSAGRRLGPLMRSPGSPSPNPVRDLASGNSAGSGARSSQESGLPASSPSPLHGLRSSVEQQISPLLGSLPFPLSSGAGLIEEETPLQTFLGELEAIRGGPLRDLETNLDESKDLHARALRAVSATQEREALKLVERRAELASLAAQRTCQALQELSKKVNAHNGGGPSEVNLRKQSFSGVTVIFQNALSSYFQAQQTFRQEMENKVSRQLRAAFPEADDNAVRQVAAGRKSAAVAIQDTLLMQSGTGPLKTSLALEMAQERCDELEKLVKVATQLRQAFTDVELLVNAQGEVIDDIGRHVAATRDQTKAAMDYLELAHAQQQRSRCRCLALVIGLIVVLGVIVYFFSVFVDHLDDDQDGEGPALALTNGRESVLFV